MGAALTIRATGRSDIAAVDALLAASYPILLKTDYPPSVLVTALPLISRAQPRLLTSGTYYVAERDGQVLGAGGWTGAAPGDGRAAAGTGHIRHVVTDHRAVRQGVGRALMAHILTQAQSAGLTRMTCQATRTAVPFYVAMGFTVQGEIEVTLRPGITFPAVQMYLGF